MSNDPCFAASFGFPELSPARDTRGIYSTDRTKETQTGLLQFLLLIL